MAPITLLGPQYRVPNLRDALGRLGLSGPFVSISAGWQEREGELDELRAHVDAEVYDLRIYERSERVFEADPELRRAHRRRQATLREMQQLYEVQLGHLKHATRELFVREGSEPLLRQARRRAIAALRRLDHAHAHSIRELHRRFEAETGLAERPAVADCERQIARYVNQAEAVFVAGGHVAVLLNRLRLLGGARLFQDRPVVAWSAGAMALTERVVLFHDSPPQGQANVALFDAGLGLAGGVVALPHAARRLELGNAGRVRILARRFAPASCITLDEGAQLDFEAGNSVRTHGGRRLRRDGTVVEQT